MIPTCVAPHASDDGPDDRALVAAVLAGEHGAFTRLVTAHQALVWRMLYRMVGNTEDTCELSQEVFLRVHRQLAQFRFDAALGTWIARIAFSIASRHLRRKRLPLADDGDALLPLVDAGVDLETEADAEQRARLLAQAVDALPPLQRTLLTLYHVDEMKIPDIAIVVGLPVGTIKSHLFRTRRCLLDRLPHLAGDLA